MVRLYTEAHHRIALIQLSPNPLPHSVWMVATPVLRHTVAPHDMLDIDLKYRLLHRKRYLVPMPAIVIERLPEQGAPDVAQPGRVQSLISTSNEQTTFAADATS